MKWTLLFCAVLVIALPGCGSKASGSGGGEEIVFFNVTTDGSDDAQRVDMAMKLAGFSLDEKRKVVIFFNVKGVKVPTTTFAADFKYGEEPPIKEQLEKLIERGAEVHVCPICMKALGVDKGDILKGAEVTTRPKLFARITGNTAVFTY